MPRTLMTARFIRRIAINGLGLLAILVALGCDEWTGKPANQTDLEAPAPIKIGVKQSALAPLPITGQKLNLYSYGAIGDCVADDGPAMQALFDDVGLTGGAREFTEGCYRVATPVSSVTAMVHGNSYAISGRGSASVVMIDLANTAYDGITLNAGVASTISLRDFVVIGNRFHMVAHVGIRLQASYYGGYNVENVSAYGLWTTHAAVMLNGGVSKWSNSTFVSCIGSARGVLAVELSTSAVIKQNGFADLALAHDVGYSAGAGPYWVTFNSPSDAPYGAGTLASDTRYLVEDNDFDEGAYGVFAYNWSGFRGKSISVVRNRFHVSSVSGMVGFFANNWQYVYSAQNWYGYAAYLRDAVVLTNVGHGKFFQDVTQTQQPSGSKFRSPAGYNNGVVDIEECDYTPIESGATRTFVTKNGVKSLSIAGGAFNVMPGY